MVAGHIAEGLPQIRVSRFFFRNLGEGRFEENFEEIWARSAVFILLLDFEKISCIEIGGTAAD